MYLLIKPASGACNLRCRYCFYSDEMNNREAGVRHVMTFDTADAVISRAFDQLSSLPPAGRTLSLGFQGGEPTLAGLDFFRRITELVRTRNHGINVMYFIQTNGTLLNDEWAEFLHAENFLVGLSLDGTPEIHDKNRITADGKGTHSTVMRAAKLLSSHNVNFNILTVLTGDAARSAGKIYNFYKKNGFEWQQFIPCLAPIDKADTPWALTPEKYGTFLCRTFDLWYRDFLSGTQVYNREFDNWVGIIAGYPPEDCGMRGICSPQYLIESDGSVYPCDFYAMDSYLLGNIRSDSFGDIDKKREEIGFIAESAVLNEKCGDCRWKFLCRGGCKRNRSENGLNRFCSAYITFFDYAYPRLCEAAKIIARRR